MNSDIMTKAELDNVFNHLFFSRDFIDKMIRRFGICPAGLTIDTHVENGNMTFLCVTKKYGYDNSIICRQPDAAWDDYEILDDKINAGVTEFMWEYVRVNNPKLYGETHVK